MDNRNVPTFADLFDYMHNKHAAWKNYGDADYIEYGGCQVRYDCEDVEVMELRYNDESKAFTLAEDCISIIGKSWAMFDNEPGDTLLEARPTGSAVARFGDVKFTDHRVDIDGLRQMVADHPEEKDLSWLLQVFAEYVIDLGRAWIGYYGSQSSVLPTWKLADYELEADDPCAEDDAYAEAAAEVEKVLLEAGADIVPEYYDANILEMFKCSAQFGKAEDPGYMPDMPHNWRVKLTFQGRQMDIDYFGGAAVHDVDKKSVLYSLLSDMRTAEDYDSILRFAKDFGYDCDTYEEVVRVENIWERLNKQAKEFSRLLGSEGYRGDYEKVVEELDEALRDF